MAEGAGPKSPGANGPVLTLLPTISDSDGVIGTDFSGTSTDDSEYMHERDYELHFGTRKKADTSTRFQ